MSNVTIKSIANRLGISFSTVSKALNGDPNVSEKTRELVAKTAQEMHYTRNVFAQSLRQKGSKTVAILLNDIDVPAYGEMVAAISSELAAYGYTTLIADARYSLDLERSSIQTMLGWMPEAVIVSPADPASESMKLLAPLSDRTLVLGSVEGANISSLEVDHRLAGFLSAEHMLQCGVKNNLIFGGPMGYQSSELFLAGVKDAYAKYGVELRDDAVYRFRPEIAAAHDLFADLWRQQPGLCEGVICFCDSMALGIYKAAAELGLSVPDDVSVIGYDDSPIHDFTAPPLTTIHMPKDLVAKNCTQYVLDLLLGGNTQTRTYLLRPFLHERGSVRQTQGESK